MINVPQFIIESDRYGWNHGGQFRFADTEKSVRNSLRGLLARYPDAEIKVHRINVVSDVTRQFVLGAE